MYSIAVTEQVLDALLESLVLRYAYNREERTLILVADYGRKLVGSSRAFMMLKFQGVASFERRPGVREKLQSFVTEYVSSDGLPPTVIQAVDCDFEEGRKRLELDLGPSFGVVAFTFERATGRVRDTHAEKAGDTWKYFDFETGEALDFYDLFRGVN